MNPRAEVWNVLHDGEVVHIQKGNSGDLFLTVKIPYLSRMLYEGDNILVTLKRCSRFSMTIWEQDLTTDDVDLITQQRTEILSTKSEDTPVHLVTTLGEIEADFDSFSLAEEGGTEITFQTLCDACEKYWNQWEKESKAAYGE